MNIVSCLVLTSLGLVLIRAECPGDEVQWGSYGYFQTCRSHHIRQALQENVMCKPSPTVVQLPLPNNTDIQQMTPTFVEILQCSGACHRGNQECVPTKTREKKIPVMLARCGISTGKCEKECASVTVVEHVECGCDCGHVDRDTCPTNTHVYDTDTCSCKCANTEEKQQCLDQGRTWSTTNCSCQCPDINPSLACSNGLVWSNVTCTCEPEDVVLHLVEEEEDRTPRSGTTEDKLFTWQHITIIVLLVLIFILIATIFALISKLQTAKRRIKTAKLQAAAINQNNYSSNADDAHLYDLYASSQGATPRNANKQLVVKAKDAKNPEKFYSEVYGEMQRGNGGAVQHTSLGGMYCESPSSGFGSEASKYSSNDLHTDTTGPITSPSESIYHSAQTVRLNKKLQNIGPAPVPCVYNNPACHQPQPCCSSGNMMNAAASGVVSDPIDEAVRLLEHSAAMLQ